MEVVHTVLCVGVLRYWEVGKARYGPRCTHSAWNAEGRKKARQMRKMQGWKMGAGKGTVKKITWNHVAQEWV